MVNPFGDADVAGELLRILGARVLDHLDLDDLLAGEGREAEEAERAAVEALGGIQADVVLLRAVRIGQREVIAGAVQGEGHLCTPVGVGRRRTVIVGGAAGIDVLERRPGLVVGRRPAVQSARGEVKGKRQVLRFGFRPRARIDGFGGGIGRLFHADEGLHVAGEEGHGRAALLAQGVLLHLDAELEVAFAVGPVTLDPVHGGPFGIGLGKGPAAVGGHGDFRHLAIPCGIDPVGRHLDPRIFLLLALRILVAGGKRQHGGHRHQ